MLVNYKFAAMQSGSQQHKSRVSSTLKIGGQVGTLCCHTGVTSTARMKGMYMAKIDDRLDNQNHLVPHYTYYTYLGEHGFRRPSSGGLRLSISMRRVIIEGMLVILEMSVNMIFVGNI